MSLITIIEGERNFKLSGNPQKRQVVIPQVCANEKGDCAEFGVGVELPDEELGFYWGLASPRRQLIRSWRGMKILEALPAVSVSILRACWYAGGKVRRFERHYLKELEPFFPTKRAFNKLRSEVMAKGPTAVVLNEAVKNAYTNGILVDPAELQREINKGTILAIPNVLQMIDVARNL